VIFIYNAILFIYKEKQNNVIFRKKMGGNHVKQMKPDRKTNIVYSLSYVRSRSYKKEKDTSVKQKNTGSRKQ
jgi:hypothetical protein